MKTDNKNNLNGVSKAISIIAKILEVIMIVGASFTLIVTIALPFLFKSVKVTDTSFSIGKFKIADFSKEELIKNGFDSDTLNTVVTLLQDQKQMRIIPVYTFIATVALVILAFFFYYLYKLFDNIRKEDTPFTQKNIDLITKMIFALIGYIAIPTIISWIVEIFANVDFQFSWSLKDVIALLVLFAIRLIFEYGLELEQKINKKK